jgi:hypothetical protein
MTIPIDDQTHPDEHELSKDETVQGNPGKPQSDYETGGPEHAGQTPQQRDPTDTQV